jgi:hypothetical protein
MYPSANTISSQNHIVSEQSQKKRALLVGFVNSTQHEYEQVALL